VFVIKKSRPVGFKFVIVIDGTNETIKFINGRYECPTAEYETAIEKLLIKPQFMQNIQKVDLAAGEAIALAHMQNKGNSAIKGGSTSESMKMQSDSVARQDAEAVADVMAKDGNIMITHDTKLPDDITDKIVGVKINLGN